LLTAILRKAPGVVKLLLQHGALISQLELWKACTVGSEEILNLLVEMGDLREALIQRSSEFGHNVMMKVCMFCSDLECCTIIPLLMQDNMVAVDEVDDNRRTALFYACLFGKPNAIKILLELGANPNHVDIFMNNLAHMITTSVVFDILVSSGLELKLNEVNLFGWTPYHVARAIQAHDVTSAMIAAGADTRDPETDMGLVKSWQYRINVPFAAGNANDEFLV
jgi:ankyrin repeat protein